MFKKILAGVSAVAIALGMVVLVAGPASAHHSTITGTVECTSPTEATITWSVQNWNGGKKGKVDSSTSNIVPAGTQFESNETKTFTQDVTGTGTYNLSVTMSWKAANGTGPWTNTTTNSGSVTVDESDFECLEDDVDKKIDICHATASDSNPYTTNNVSVSSIITGPNGHDTHDDDIIPPFDYVEGGVQKSYPGKNWDAYGQAVYRNGCGGAETTPADVTFEQPQCVDPGESSEGGYTIPAIPAGVIYTVTLNGIESTGTEGFHALEVGDVVSVVAAAAEGYELAEGDWSWGPWTVVSAGDCLEEAPVTAATAVDQTCVVDEQGGGSYVSGWITIPNSPNVNYFIDGIEAGTGDHPLPPGDYEVTAEAEQGYLLTGYTGPWNLTIEAAEACGDLVVKPLVTPVVTFVQETCEAEGSYTLATEEGEPGAVVWTVSGGLPNTEGTHVVTTAGIVTVTAEPAEGYGFAGDTPLLEWSFEFEAAADCDLDTLPLTGGTPAGILGLAGMLLLGGAFLVAARQRRVVVED